jgi:hypothetical protein
VKDTIQVIPVCQMKNNQTIMADARDCTANFKKERTEYTAVIYKLPRCVERIYLNWVLRNSLKGTS